MGSAPPSPWPRRAGIFLALLVCLGAGSVYMWPRPARLRPLAEAAPGENLALPFTALEAALPPNAAFVFGAVDLPQSWASLQTSQFFQTLRARLPAGLPDAADPARFLGARAAVAVYPLGIGRRDWVALAAAAPGVTVAELLSRAPAPYAARVGNTWVLSSSARLGAEAAERLASRAPAEDWLVKAFTRVPSRSAFYGAVNFQAARPIAADKAVHWDKKHPWLWAAGGLRVENGLRIDQVAEPRGGSLASFRDPPRALRMTLPLGDDAAAVAAFAWDLRRAWRETVAGLTPDEKLMLDKMLGAAREKFDIDRRLIPFLGNECGIFIGRNSPGAILPPAAVFVRLRYSWVFRLGVWKALKDGGWKREGGLWTYAAGGGIVPADLALAFHRGFAVLGTREGVEALRRPSPPSGPLAKALEAARPPEAVNGLFAVDVAGVVDGLRRSYAAWRPGAPKNKGPDWTQVFAVVPPYAGYAVNAQEGAYSKIYADLQDRPASEWRRLWDKFLPPASAAAAPARRTEAYVPTEAPRVQVRSARGATSVSIRGAAAPVDSGSNIAHAVSGGRRLLLRDPDWMVRRDAVRALGETGTAKDIPSLQPLLKDRRPEVRAAAQKAILALRRRSVPAKKR